MKVGSMLSYVTFVVKHSELNESAGKMVLGVFRSSLRALKMTIIIQQQMRGVFIYTVMLRHNAKNLQHALNPVGSYAGRIYVTSLLLFKKRLTATLSESPV
jgi:hypothetical protein